MPILKHERVTPTALIQYSVIDHAERNRYIIARSLGEATQAFIEYNEGDVLPELRRTEGTLVVMKPSDFKRLCECIRGAHGSWNPDTVRHYALKALDIINQI